MRLLLIALVIWGVYTLSNPSEQFANNLSYGTMHSNDVSHLQTFLQGGGLYDGPITGNFLEQTEGAVKRFQKESGIETTGYFGQQSRQAANALVAAGQYQFPLSQEALYIIGGIIICVIIFWDSKIRRSSRTSSSHDSSYDTSDSSYSHSSSNFSSDEPKAEEEKTWSFPFMGRGATSSRQRTGWGNEKYYEDNAGNKIHERSGWGGEKYLEDKSGNKMHERTGWGGEKYYEDSNGNKVREQTGWGGEKYYEDSEGNKVHERTDWAGNKYFEKG